VPIPSDFLVTVAQLSRFGLPSAFLAQFEPRPIDILISTAGALGTMQYEWRWTGEADWSAPVVSDAGATWSSTIEDAFVDLSFSAFSYVASAVYSVNRAGVVTGGAGAPTATRFDLRTNACSAVTSEAMTLMRDAIRSPLLTWGDDARMHAAQMVYAILKRGRGLAPADAAVGDENVFKGEDLGRAFFAAIGKNGRPDNMTDTSVTVDGPMFAAYPSGSDPQGW
jgi:hypothetical protein